MGTTHAHDKANPAPDVFNAEVRVHAWILFIDAAMPPFLAHAHIASA